MQIIVMTSDNQSHILRGFNYLWNKYGLSYDDSVVICGFTLSDEVYEIIKSREFYDWYSIGEFKDYPASKWSDALIKVIDDVAVETFTLLLDDYWLIRRTDFVAMRMIHDYMHQFQNVIRFDLTSDRLYADGGTRYLWNNETYDTLSYLDLIKSHAGSAYHLSLWGSMWRRDLLRQVLVEGETAQQIEINGTARLSQYGDEMLVLGTRQAPVRHANVIQRGTWNQDATTGLPALKESDRKELERLGYI